MNQLPKYLEQGNLRCEACAVIPFLTGYEEERIFYPRLNSGMPKLSCVTL